MQLLGSSNRWHILVNLVSAIFEMADFLSSKKPVIAVDLDEVLGDFVPAIAEWHNNTYGTKLLPSHFFSYAFKDVWGGTDAESVEKVHQFFETDYFKNMKPINEAREVLTRLKEKFEFVVVTSRQHTIADETRRWLGEHYNNIFAEVYFGNHWSKDAPNPDLAGKNKTSKPDMCKRVNALAIIDDSTKYAYQCAPLLKKVILFGNYAWNQTYGETIVESEYKNVVRLSKWVEVEQELLSLLNDTIYPASTPSITEGALFQYTSTPCQLQAFESGVIGSKNVLIMVGGLTDGLLACPYVPALSIACKAHSYALIQPILRSSYCQFGMQTLANDVEDLNSLVDFLRSNRGDDLAITFIGHSTGCQIAVTFCKTSQLARNFVKKIVLQAPVSDREALLLEESKDFVENLIVTANNLVEAGKGRQIVHSLYGIAPLTATRTLDLFSEGGLDDMFSSYLTDEQLKNRLGHMKAFQTMISISLDDQYVPAGVYPLMGKRMKDAMNADLLIEIADADHSLRQGQDAMGIFMKSLLNFVFV